MKMGRRGFGCSEGVIIKCFMARCLMKNPKILLKLFLINS